jgi:putative ABC transport system permease protein
MHSLRHDLRYALRSLRRSPAFAATAILTFALGIGATTSIFSVVNGVVLRRLPFPSPEALVQVHTRIEGEPAPRGSLSPPNFTSMQDGSPSFTAVSALLVGDHVVSGVGQAYSVPSARVSASFFQVLGVVPAMGRGFRPGENDPGAEPVAVISHTMWQELLSGVPDVLGRRIPLDGVPHVVVGVMPAGFTFPEGTSLWVPLRHDGAFSATTAQGRKSNTWIPVIGRLRAGLEISRARLELESFSRELERAFPGTNAGVRFTLVPLHTELVGEVRQPLFLLLAAVALLLVIACTNIAGLLLARAATRREEMAIRGALGAGRGRLVQLVLTEAMVLGLGGGLAGVLLAWWATPILATASPTALPRLNEVTMDIPVLAFALGVTLVAALIAGGLPALRTTGGRLSGALRSGGRSGLASASGHRVRGALVVGQLALAVTLLSGGGLLLRSFEKLMSVNPGFTTRRTIAFRLEAPSAAYSSNEAVAGFFDRALTATRAVPGVEIAGAVSRLPLASSSLSSRFRVDRPGSPGEATAEAAIGVRSVAPDYFAALGIPVRRGRAIVTADHAAGIPVAVINDAAARRFFPDEDPVGRRLVSFSYDPIEEAADAFTIVGVVGDVRHAGLDRPAEPEVYFAHAQVPLSALTIVARTSRDLATVIPALRNVVAALDPNLPAPAVQTLDDVVAASVARTRFVTMLLGLFATLALALAALGMFGLLSFSVDQRTREFGIRMALGADAGHVVSLATGRAAGLIAIGLGVGIVGALLGSRALEGMLFEVGPADPLTMAGVVALLVATGLAAAWIPARRAASVDPVIALREE